MDHKTKFAEMIVLTNSQIRRAPNVHLPCGFANNAVNARCFRDGVAILDIMRLHLHNLLNRLVGVLPRGVTAPLGSPHCTSSMRFLSSFTPIHWDTFSNFLRALCEAS